MRIRISSGRPPKPPRGPVPRVAELVCYPVKGCAGIAVTESTVTATGLEHDRSFMVIGRDGDHRTQRTHPRLALIRPDIDTEGTRLVLSAPGTGSVEVDVDTTGPRRDVTLFGTAYRGIDQGAVVAEWLSRTLGSGSRLVRVPPEHDRVTGGHTPGRSGYADSCPIHLLSESSLDSFDRGKWPGPGPLPANRFRPNIVVTGWHEPHVEDEAREVRIGEAALGYAKPAIRCAVTTVAQDSGAKSGPEPLRTLAEYRRTPEGGLAFGAKFAVTGTGRIAVGDEVTVPTWGPSEV